MSDAAAVPGDAGGSVSGQGSLGQLRHFRVDARLGEGGMGQVFLGFDTSLARPVALKVVRPELSSLPGFLDRFLVEAQAQARVAHANVVQVYFVGEEQGTWFMALELVDAGSLEDFVKRKQKLTWGDAVRHFIGLAEGLREAYRLGIVHRDIKPANVLLDRFGMAHLADFGLATPSGIQDMGIADTAPAPRLTAVGAIVGTPTYMAPEQARGDPVDARADIYALGATFYELLTGVPAVTARTIPEAQQFHQSRRAPPVRRLAHEVPRPVARIIDRCLETRAEDRYQDYDELLGELRVAAPRPLVKARAPQRLLAWVLDAAAGILVTRFTLQTIPWLGVLAQALWICGVGGLLGATPGQWLMRVNLRTPVDGEVSAARLAWRFVLQFGWELPAALGLARVYASEVGPWTQALLAAGAGGFLLVALGSLPAIFGPTGRTLHDRLSGTRALLDIR